MLEREFIEWIRQQTKLSPEAIPVGPGDDFAVVACGDERLCVTTDQVLDGVHFRLTDDGARAVGRKAMARGLSDIAAMAGQPVAATASVALPKGLAQTDAQEIYIGLRELADEFDCPIVGGDVGSWDGLLQISVHVIGRPVSGLHPILRSGANAGDAICVTGELGGAWRTSRHLTFTPRIREAIQLASNYELHSMIDISDGLGKDLKHICEASGLGAEIVAADIPVHEDARKHTEDEPVHLPPRSVMVRTMKLLFTLPREQTHKLCKDQPLTVKVTCIGQIVVERDITLIRQDGGREQLRPTGWEHET